MTHRLRAQSPTLGAYASHRIAVLLAAVTFPILSGCEGEGGLSVIRPEIYGEPPAGTTLAFDEVVLGRTEAPRLVFRVGNRGDALLTIRDIRIEGEGADQFVVLPGARNLSPGQTTELFVDFEATRPAQHSATLVISSNDLDRPEVSWPLFGPARPPCRLDVAPDFQNFELGEIRQVTITARDYACVISGLQTDRSVFDFVDEPELPFTVEKDETYVLQVQHSNLAIQPGGTPTRELLVRELGGTEATVILAGVPPVSGCLSISPDTLRFATVERGTIQVQSVRVRNTCGEEAAVTSVAMSRGFYFYSVERDGYPRYLAPGEVYTIPVTYEAFSPLGDFGLLSINTNDATNPRFRVELTGQADLPQAEVFPANIDFGSVVYKNPGADSRSECSSNAQEIRLYSAGSASLTVTSIAVDAISDPLFQVTTVLVNEQPIFDLSQPIIVPAGGQMRIFVQFFPSRTEPAEHRGTLRILHNGDGGVETVTLRGVGVPDGAVSDVFEQLVGPTVDILWVIDDSCSMYDEQARLIQNLTPFVAYADSQDASYQMGVTVTDSRSSGAGRFRRCWPHPPIIGNDYADAATRSEAFECTFLVGTDNISFYEAGLGAAMRALERATDPSFDPETNPNVGFVRQDAKLAIVTVSDEDDQSSESFQVLKDFFLSIKGFNRPDLVNVYSIAGPVANECAQGPRFAEPGYRYYRMTQEVGGQFFDICLEDWQPVLNNLGLDLFTPLDEWNLSQAADPGSLVVAVDGIPIPADPVSGYTYLPASNSIRFNGSAVPAPGAQITADYTGLCRP